MEHSQTQEKNKSDSETLSKTLDDIDLSSNTFLDFENFSKFYEVSKIFMFIFFLI